MPGNFDRCWQCLSTEASEPKPNAAQLLSEVEPIEDAGTSSPRSRWILTRLPRRILWLTVAHVVAGLIGSLAENLARHSPLVGGLFWGLFFGQISLLAIWGALGANPWSERRNGLIIGFAYHVALWSQGSDLIVSVAVVAIALVTMSLPLLIVRRFRVSIHRDPFPNALVSLSQFSIRDLLILTFVIACLTSIGKLLSPEFSDRVFWISVVMSGILPVWFVLATKQPVVYSVGLVGLVAVGACAGYCLGGDIYGSTQRLCMIGNATEAMTVVVSLLVVRSCGYRLVRLPAPPETDSAAVSELSEAAGDRTEQESPGPHWKCPACGETIPDTFDMCWKCRSPKAN